MNRILFSSLLLFAASAYAQEKNKKMTMEVDGVCEMCRLRIEKAAMVAVGHDTEELKATEEVYDKIMPCCKYRDEKIVNDHKN